VVVSEELVLDFLTAAAMAKQPAFEPDMAHAYTS
jgi:hypothetical protein